MSTTTESTATYTPDEITRAVEQEVEYMTRDARLADNIADGVVRRLEEEREDFAIGREG